MSTFSILFSHFVLRQIQNSKKIIKRNHHVVTNVPWPHIVTVFFFDFDHQMWSLIWSQHNILYNSSHNITSHHTAWITPLVKISLLPNYDWFTWINTYYQNATTLSYNDQYFLFIKWQKLWKNPFFLGIIFSVLTLWRGNLNYVINWLLIRIIRKKEASRILRNTF